MYFHEGCNGIASFERSSYGLCVECKTSTKYKCINWKVCVCNRPSCSVAEVDEETDGWVEYLYKCCILQQLILGYNRLMPLCRIKLLLPSPSLSSHFQNLSQYDGFRYGRHFLICCLLTRLSSSNLGCHSRQLNPTTLIRRIN